MKTKPKYDEDLLSNLFKPSYGSSNYSTTEYTCLKSTTYTFNRVTYCVHCHSKALSIQGDIEDYEEYHTTGHRCTCIKAIKEMARLVALELEDFQFPPKETVHSLSKTRYLLLLKGLDSRDLPLSELHCNKDLPEIIYNKAKLGNLNKFFHNSVIGVKFYLKDDYYNYLPIYQFCKLVEDLLQSYKEADILTIEGMLVAAKKPITSLFNNEV